MSDPVVSIVIPCRNMASTIADTLNSLRWQRFRKWEAIVVDDGSVDDSISVARSTVRGDRRFVWMQAASRGLGAARNSGIREARGEFLLFLDSDDLLAERMLDQVLKALLREDKTAWAVCGWIYSDPALRNRGWRNTPRWPGALFQALAHINRFPCHAVMLRRCLLDRTGLFDEGLKHCHDWDLWQRVARIDGSPAVVPEPLAVYRMMPGSLSRSPRTLMDAGMEVIRRAHAFDPRVADPDAQWAAGCCCGENDVRVKEWVLQCTALALAQGDARLAMTLMVEGLQGPGAALDDAGLARLGDGLWFPAATTPGHWEAVWPLVHESLPTFLSQMEREGGMANDALHAFIRLVGWPGECAATRAESLGGRQLARLLLKRARAVLKEGRPFRK